MWMLFDNTLRRGTVIRRDDVAKRTCQVKNAEIISTTTDQIFFMLEDVNNITTGEAI